MVYVLHEENPKEDTLNIDIARCRFNGLAENVFALPVFSPIDEILPATFGELVDYNWVEAKCRYPVMALPYWGPAWYSKASCAYMLDHGIIQLQDIKFAYDASTKIDPARLQGWMGTLENLWATVIANAEVDVATYFTPKHCLNAMAGVWAMTERFTHLLLVTNEPTDVRFTGPVDVRDTPGAQNDEKDYVTTSKMLQLSSMRPIHQICLEAERLNVARALYIIRKHCKPERILSIQVDRPLWTTRNHRPQPADGGQYDMWYVMKL